MKADLNERITRIGPGTPCGQLMRHYWQPVALVDEFNPALDPNMAIRPVKAVRLLGQDLVLFKNANGEYGLLDRDCPHRGADLSFGRHEGDGLRCPFHGWKFDAQGQCTDTPAEPSGSTLCRHIRQRSYPLIVRSGVLFAWLGEEGSTPPPTPSRSRACGIATGCRPSRWVSTRLTPRSCTVSSSTRRWTTPTADSSVVPVPAMWAASAGR